MACSCACAGGVASSSARHADLLAYFRVLLVSSKSASQLEMQLISTVSAFPPKLSCRSRVNLESLQAQQQAKPSTAHAMKVQGRMIPGQQGLHVRVGNNNRCCNGCAQQNCQPRASCVGVSWLHVLPVGYMFGSLDWGLPAAAGPFNSCTSTSKHAPSTTPLSCSRPAITQISKSILDPMQRSPLPPYKPVLRARPGLIFITSSADMHNTVAVLQVGLC